MPTILPPPPPPPPSPSNPGPSLPSVVLAKAPPGLAGLQIGSRFEGVVVTDGGKTAIQVQTTQGTVEIQTLLPLQKGARVDLLLQMLSPRFQAQLVAIDGKSPFAFLRPGAAAGAHAPAATHPTAGGQPTTPFGPTATLGQGAPTGNALIGATLVATLTRPTAFVAAAQGPAAGTAVAPGAAAMPATAPGTPAPGASPTTAATTPGSPQPAGTPQGLNAAPAAQGQSPAASAKGAAAASNPPQPAGAQFNIRILAIAPAPQGQPLPPPPPAGAVPVLAQGQTLTATVTGTTPSGLSVLQTPVGTLSVSSPVPLPAGASVTFTVAGSAQVPSPDAPPSASARTLLMSRAFPALEDALKTLQDANPNLAQQISQSVIPRPDSQLGATMLLFLSALRGGDLRSLFGDSGIRIIERAKPGSAARVGDEFRQLSRMANEPVTPDWRVALVPMHTQEGLNQVRLMLRPDSGANTPDDDDKGGGTRFVIDLNLSQLGRIQLDGLVRGAGRRVDLIVRTADPMASAMRDDIRRIFRSANETTGIDGDLAFQVGSAVFVDIEPDRLVELQGDVVV